MADQPTWAIRSWEGAQRGLSRPEGWRIAALAVPFLLVVPTPQARAVAIAAPELRRPPGADAAPPAAATTTATLSHQRVLPYPLHHVWPTAIRYLRVDRGYAILDRDEHAGYILFDFPLGRTSEATGRGSLEAFAVPDAAGREGVHLQVSTDSGPTHLPHALAEGILAKLRAERGQPPPPPQPREPSKPKPPPEEVPDPPNQPPPGTDPDPILFE